MKKIILVILGLLILTGCSKEKISLDGDAFVDNMENQGYTMFDQTSSYPYSISAYSTEQFGITVVYIESKKKADIRGIFLDQCLNVYKNVKEDYKESASSGPNWSSLEVYDSEKYFYVSLVDNTYIYITGDAKDKKEMKKIYTNLGY